MLRKLCKNTYEAVRFGMWIDKKGWCHFMPDWYTNIIWRNVDKQ